MSIIKLLYLRSLAIGLLGIVFIAPMQAELIGLWRFEGDATDASVHGNDGSLEDGATFSDDTPEALPGQALSLIDGAYVKVPHAEILNVSNALTISAFVKARTPAKARLTTMRATMNCASKTAHGSWSFFTNKGATTTPQPNQASMR